MFLPIRILAATCLMSASLWAQTRTQTAYLAPNLAESGKPFSVTVSGKTTLCNPQFSHQKATVDNGSILLSVMAVNDPVAKCTAGEHDYQTDFDLPALKAASYEVNVSLQPACAYSQPLCPFAMILDYAGTLGVKDSADLNYAIRPKLVQGGKAFDLFLTNKQFTCGNEFSDLSSHVEGHILYLSFTNRPHPEALCAAVIKDYGPTFPIPALKAGTYQVFATSMPYCGTVGPCPVAFVLPQLAGALTATDGTAAVGGGGKAASGKSALRDANGSGALRIDARQGVTGLWHGKSSTLTGRRNISLESK